MQGSERKQMKQDEFVDGAVRVVEFLTEKRKPVLILVGAVLVLVIAGWSYLKWSDARADAAADAFAKGQIALFAPLAGDEPPKPDSPFTPVYADGVSRARAAAERLEAVASGSGPLADLAAFLRGVALLDAGETEEALPLLESAREAFASDITMAGTTRSALARAYEILGRWDDALVIWEEMRDTETDQTPYPRDLVLEGLARAAEKAGKTEEARIAYQSIVSEYPNSPAKARAEAALLRL